MTQMVTDVTEACSGVPRSRAFFQQPAFLYLWGTTQIQQMP